MSVSQLSVSPTTPNHSAATNSAICSRAGSEAARYLPPGFPHELFDNRYAERVLLAGRAHQENTTVVFNAGKAIVDAEQGQENLEPSHASRDFYEITEIFIPHSAKQGRRWRE